MDGYQPSQFHMLSEHKKFCQDNSLTMDQGTPYSINMNVFLPDVTYLRTGMCRPVRSGAPQIRQNLSIRLSTTPVAMARLHPPLRIQSTQTSTAQLQKRVAMFTSSMRHRPSNSQTFHFFSC